uniref:Uncharacterized protein n=1 Tax=Rhizophora mucronata TaxID=61149 RepID=A0A2P2MKT9_RHIMU
MRCPIALIVKETPLHFLQIFFSNCFVA